MRPGPGAREVEGSGIPGFRSARRRLSGLFDGLFPVRCLLCGRARPSERKAPLCEICLHRLPRPAHPRCRRCGATRVLDVTAPGRCPECEDWPAAPERVAAPFLMRAGAEGLVHGLKFGRWTALAEPMGRAMAPEARRLVGPGSARLVPVPISPARLRERGFNQATLLALALGRATGLAVAEPLARRPGGRRQARLGRRARRENVERLFHVAPDALPLGLGPLLLVDDVLTTGATAAACARALEEAGGRVVGAVVFARALQPIDAR